jgi:predicted Zn-dependent protease
MKRLLVAFGLAICTFLSIVWFQVRIANASLPATQVHPLPPTLERWQDRSTSGDYFSEIKPSKIGYLIWSEFPIAVYVQRPGMPVWASASARRFQQWVDAVLPAIQEWNPYLPMVVVDRPEEADIAIWRSHPPLQITPDGPYARAALVSYEIYQKRSSDRPVGILSHKYTMFISPDLSLPYIQAAARHELGHALGIWGHSRVETDALYFTQVRNPPAISPRDINTLKRIYQQPTQLGWPIASVGSSPR